MQQDKIKFGAEAGKLTAYGIGGLSPTIQLGGWMDGSRGARGERLAELM